LALGCAMLLICDLVDTRPLESYSFENNEIRAPTYINKADNHIYEIDISHNMWLKLIH
jgi:hypothetical protein